MVCVPAKLICTYKPADRDIKILGVQSPTTPPLRTTSLVASDHYELAVRLVVTLA